MSLQFLNFWPSLICTDPLLNIQLSINNSETGGIFNFEIVLFNIELLGLYIDDCKTHIGLLGFGLGVWYNQNEED